ncbi:MAG: hypothetical protein C0404_01625 [Verrucomicrobia bacterium]|nr:hypothetical protein [Verrucomicrobiota bacterium]
MKTRLLCLSACLALMLSSSAVVAINMDMDVEVDARFTSANVWRGQILNDEACFQPELYFRGSNLAFSLWGTWNLTDAPGGSTQTRMDAALEYSYVLGERNIFKPGLIGYIYHDDQAGKAKDTFEVYLKYTLDTIMLPSVEAYYDFSQVEGFYGVFQLLHSFDVGSAFEMDQGMVGLDFKAAVGAADKAYLAAKFRVPANTELKTEEFVPDEAGLVAFTAEVSLPSAVGDRIVVKPAVKYMTLLNDEIKDALKNVGKDTDEIVYSLTIGVTF